MELMIKKEYCKVFYYAESRYSKKTILVKISKDGKSENIEKELTFKNYDEWKESEYYCKEANFNCSNCSYCYNCSNCSYCSYCSDCSGCSYCSDCSDCSNCSYCSYCSDCSGCSYCSYCSDCSDCSGCSYYIKNKKFAEFDRIGE